MMHHIQPPVSNAVIFVCEKCGRRLDSGSDKNPSRRLVSRLKKLAKKTFGRGEVRAIATSCMDVCPEDEVSVALATFGHGRHNVRFLTVRVDDVEETAREILQALK